jgi:hypothetical protein
VFISVPRLLERTYDRILGKEGSGRDKETDFFWAVNLGMKYKIPDNNMVL